MYKKISRSAEINARFQSEGKVTPRNIKEDMAKISSMNKYMEEVSRDYQVKERLSQISASKVILTA